ncbi:exo-alpha-sialidase [Trypanosoma cruzi]|nr:exo-alpha-sialidase [Trypanosoma cruzi]
MSPTGRSAPAPGPLNVNPPSGVLVTSPRTAAFTQRYSSLHVLSVDVLDKKPTSPLVRPPPPSCPPTSPSGPQKQCCTHRPLQQRPRTSSTISSLLLDPPIPAAQRSAAECWRRPSHPQRIPAQHHKFAAVPTATSEVDAFLLYRPSRNIPAG